jgi:nucleotide-binding universal stress UspA family protein
MFKNVLVGVDGRPGGRDALALASHLTDPAGRLTLAHVHSGAARLPQAISPELLREERNASRSLLEQERATAGVSAELIGIEAGTTGAGLHRQAEDQQADLLVVGSCSRGTFGRAMLGDDARASLNGAPCAVAVAARGYGENPTAISNLGVAYNGSPESATALAVARELAAPTSAEVHALEVVSLPPLAYGGLMAAPMGEFINGIVKEGNDRMKELADIDGRAVYGLAGEELAAFGDGLDLLVVGSRSYGPVRRLVNGSTSNYLERHARCSLLVLPRTDTGPASDSASRNTELSASLS